MAKHTRLTLLVFGSLWLAAADVAQAQGTLTKAEADELGFTNPQVACPLAARIVRTEQPARLLRAARIFLLGQCPAEAPAALVASLQRLRTSTDTVALRSLMVGALYIREASFFTAALDLATDPTASAPARAAGFLIAGIELDGKNDFGLSEILAAPGPLLCPWYYSSHNMQHSVGADLPSDAAARVQAAALAVLAQEPLPAMVSNAARCARLVAKPLPVGW